MSSVPNIEEVDDTTHVSSIAELFMHNRNGPADDDSSYATRRRRFEALSRHLRESPSVAPIYELYLSMMGAIERPVICVENQPDQAFSNFLKREMSDISNEIFYSVRLFDKHQDAECGPVTEEIVTSIATNAIQARFIPPPDIAPQAPTESLDEKENRGITFFPLIVVKTRRGTGFASKKWLMKRDDLNTIPKLPGESDEKWRARVRARHKLLVVRLGLAVFDLYTNTDPIVSFLAQLKQEHLNLHDVLDAFMMAMAAGLKIYSQLASKLLPRRRPHEIRSDTPPLFHILSIQGGTIRVLGLDPGLRNLGLCVIEIAGMLPVPEHEQPVLEGAAHEPEPVFRILLMELLDLDLPWSPQRGHSRATFAPTNPQWMCPNYTTTRKPSPMFGLFSHLQDQEMTFLEKPKRARAKKTPKIKVEGETTTAPIKRGRKKKRADDDDGDNQSKPKRPRKKQKTEDVSKQQQQQQQQLSFPPLSSEQF